MQSNEIMEKIQETVSDLHMRDKISSVQFTEWQQVSRAIDYTAHSLAVILAEVAASGGVEILKREERTPEFRTVIEEMNPHIPVGALGTCAYLKVCIKTLHELQNMSDLMVEAQCDMITDWAETIPEIGEQLFLLRAALLNEFGVPTNVK